MPKGRLMMLGALLLMACGSDDEEPASAGKTNDDNAKSNGKQQTTAIYAAMDGDGLSALDSLYSAGSSSQGTVTAQAFAVELTPRTLQPLADPVGCECTGKTCTFTNCQRSSGGQVTVNGTLSTEGGAFKCDLTWEVDGSGVGVGSNTKIHIKADMTVTDTSIKGTYHTDGAVELKGISIPGAAGAAVGNVSWTNDATWDVTVSNKAPTGGTIVFSGTYKTGDKTYTGGSTVTYP